jgi:hypothetical protein
MQRQRALTAHSFYTACPVCSEPPGQYRFNSHPIDEAPAMLVDRATVSCWGLVWDPEEGPRAAQHTYRVRDGVLLALERPGHEHDDMLWAFVASSERQGLFDVRIGDVVEVHFDEPFAEVLAVTLYQIPHRVARRDYGAYRVQWSVDALTESRFVLLSSYYPDSPKTDERAFLVGWRAFGRMAADPAPPIWRVMLSNAHQHLLRRRWYLALLEGAFALEAFIDSLAAEEFAARGVPAYVIVELLRKDEVRTTLRAVADLRQYPELSTSAIKKLGGHLRDEVFAPRNALAHGRAATADIDEETARKAVGWTQEIIWDWSSPEMRHSLLLVNRQRSLDELRDAG